MARNIGCSTTNKTLSGVLDSIAPMGVVGPKAGGGTRIVALTPRQWEALQEAVQRIGELRDEEG